MGTKYSSNASSGYNATPPADDGTVSEANKVKWSTIKTKLVDPVKDLADTINSELATHFNNGPNAYTANQTLGLTNYNQVNQVSGSGVTLTLTDAATLGAGWYTDIISTDSSNNVTLARATASNTINAVSASVTILPLQELRVIVNAAATGFMTTRQPTITMGTWAPSLGGNTTYTTQVGQWIRIGNVMFVYGQLIVNVLGTGSANTVSGLPVSSYYSHPFSVGSMASVATGVMAVWGSTSGSTTIAFTGSTGAGTTTTTIFGNGTSLYFSGSYTVGAVT